ncbi:hypothetical protein [Aquibium sp. ELW1220]|uniref:hypothetical protein n=1 Tax=Aquibium sp. ELW1220 TaxID=2976766 RepID=UPI0025AFACE6|nr:hypothetical protein [Aquibium sp. ELW1220]MDN2578947.1 phage tail repeat domain-containing protein [Aquibium sp. ELW1220]
MVVRFEDLRVRDSQDLDRDFFNRRYRLIVESLNELAGQITTITTASDNLVMLGLTRVNEVLGPALAQVSAAAESGFLVATSASPLTVSVGLETTIVIDDTAARALFAPTPYVIMSRNAEGAAEGTIDDWALLEVHAYSRENGGLAFKVAAISGDIGAAQHDDWVISASAGLAKTILEAATNVTATLALAQQAAQDAAAAAATAEAVLASGPVASVNGQTGVVALGIGNIPNLTTALAGKADSNHGHGIGQISNLQTTLTSLQTQINAINDGGSY